MVDEVERNSKAPYAECWHCPFQNDPFVPTFNPKPLSGLAVVGEAPGAYEAARGIPFTGPSGRLLDQVLAHHGFNREDVMLTNTCLCRPEGNADPPKAAIAACKPRLDFELAESGVDKILAVGGTSASNLIDLKKKISYLRIGPPKPYIENPQVQVVATWHPAYSLRSPDSFPSLVSDVGKLRGRTYPIWNEPFYRVFEQVDSALEGIQRLWGVPGPLVIDIETGIDKDDEYEHPDHYELLCIGISYGVGKVVVIGTKALRNKLVIEKLGELFRDKKIVGQNIKSDIAGLDPLFGRIEAAGDTMLQSYTMDERPGLHGLEKMGIEQLGTPPWKTNFKKLVPRGGNYANAPRKALYRYNATDVHVTRTLWDLYNERMNEREHGLHKFLMRAANAIVNLELAGINFDLDYSKELTVPLEEELDQLETKLSGIAKVNINPRSPLQLMRWFNSRGLTPPNTQADTIEDMANKVSDKFVKEFIEQLLLHRRGTKLYGTYVKGFQKRIYNGKIYTTYTLHGTTSGRLASKNPNMQNIVRDKRIKRQFTVEDWEYTLIQADYKQAEGRVIATLAQDEYLASIFRDPTRDIFDELCNDIYGVGNWVTENRVSMKSIFYGNAYGRGVNAITLELQQQGSKITLEETKALMREFNIRISSVVAWQASIKHRVSSGEDLLTPFGRKRSFHLITDQNKHDVYNEALSFPPQSIASDITLTALIELQPKLQGLATTRLSVHDALIVECKKVDAGRVVDIMKTEMIAAGKAFTDYVPFVVDVSMGSNWGEL